MNTQIWWRYRIQTLTCREATIQHCRWKFKLCCSGSASVRSAPLQHQAFSLFPLAWRFLVYSTYRSGKNYRNSLLVTFWREIAADKKNKNKIQFPLLPCGIECYCSHQCWLKKTPNTYIFHYLLSFVPGKEIRDLSRSRLLVLCEDYGNAYI